MLKFLRVEPFKFSPIKGNVFPSTLPNMPPNLGDDFSYLQSLYQDDLSQLSDLTNLDLQDWCDGPPLIEPSQWV